MGDSWTKWGTEQVASNYIIANAHNSKVLSYLKYVCYYPPQTWIDHTEANIIHFIGGYRFENGFYAKVANDLIQAIQIGQ